MIPSEGIPGDQVLNGVAGGVPPSEVTQRDANESAPDGYGNRKPPTLVRRLPWIDGMTRPAGRADPDNVFYHTITRWILEVCIALRTRVFAPAIQQYL